MYKKSINRQLGLNDFDQPIGLKMDPGNRWIRKAAAIPWDRIEDKYANLFGSNVGNVAKPLRMALGSLIIQKEYGFPDRELVEQLTENPYLQYFIGLPGYRAEAPFVPSLLVEFRKRLTAEIISDINEIIIGGDDGDPAAGGDDGDPTAGGWEADGAGVEGGNAGTLILDATCAPQDIRYPQDVSLLNEAREKLDAMIDVLCRANGLPRPRTYRRKARRDYLSFAKAKKRGGKAVRKAIRQMLQYVRRNRAHIRKMLDGGLVLGEKQLALLSVLDKLYEQQKHMHDNKTHTVGDRIVSIGQPHVRPIVRGKAAVPVEFGAKMELSMAGGYGRIEKISFDAYNEGGTLVDAVERYREREGRYPERVLADKIYRNRDNLRYCGERGIRLSGPALGRPGKNAAAVRKQERTDGIDRIEVERAFSLAKRSYGLGLIRTRREDTTRSSIALSILVMNINRKARVLLSPFFRMAFSRFIHDVYTLTARNIGIQRKTMPAVA